jgi:hypothetical protein
MDLSKFLPSKNEKEKKEFFWTLVIEPDWVQAGIWNIENGKTQVVSSGPPSAWELDEELVNAADAALSSAMQSFPENLKEPNKTVFGVVSSWVSEGQITQEYLEKIKKICSDLSLNPVGFVVLPEAIAHFFKNQEGSPLTAIVLGVYKNTLEISLFRSGKLEGATKVARSVSVTDDVAEGLTRLSADENIPSRFILFDGKEGELEEVRQTLLKINWENFQKLKFLHTPKIEIIDPVKKVQTVCLAGASDLTGVGGLEIKDEKKAIEKKDIAIENTPDQTTPPQEHGFVMEKDVTIETKKEIETHEPEIVQPKLDETLKNVELVPNDSSPKKSPRFSSEISFGLFGKIKNVFSLISKRVTAIIRMGSTGRKTLIFGLAFLILITGGGFACWWYVPKAIVTIYVSSKSLRESISLFVDENAASSDFSQKILKGETVTGSAEGEKTAQTTGEKTVGEKAKGEVTIYRVGLEQTLSAGTILEGVNNLKFTLDHEVVVASGSASSPGSTKANITAEDIGSQYNLTGDTNFTVSNYSTSDFEAKNESSFSGGSSREIKVVSEEDQENLQEALEEELAEKIVGYLREGLSDNQIFIEESLNITHTSRTFDEKVGDEATTLKLTLSIDATALIVDRDEMMQISQSILEDRVPEGFVLRDEHLKVEFKFAEKDGGLYEFEAEISANLLPEINTEEIISAISGKYPDIAEDYLNNNVAGFSGAEIKLKPNLPGRLGVLPRVEKNIEVEISTER